MYIPIVLSVGQEEWGVRGFIYNFLFWDTYIYMSLHVKMLFIFFRAVACVLQSSLSPSFFSSTNLGPIQVRVVPPSSTMPYQFKCLLLLRVRVKLWCPKRRAGFKSSTKFWRNLGLAPATSSPLYDIPQSHGALLRPQCPDISIEAFSFCTPSMSPGQSIIGVTRISRWESMATCSSARRDERGQQKDDSSWPYATSSGLHSFSVSLPTFKTLCI